MRRFTETETRTFTIVCPNEDGGRIVKVGKQGGHQRYRCETCRTYFRDPAMQSKGKRYPVNQVGSALGWYYDGLSYREVARNMARTFDIPEPDESTVYRWVQSYGPAAVNAVKDMKADTGDEWVADETMVKVDKQRYWIWNVMDADTRYMLAIYLTPDRDLKAAKKVMQMAKDAAKHPPKRVRTDRLPAYKRAIKAVFDGDDVEHIQTDGLAAEVHNNLSERLQGTIKERDKVLRGFKRPGAAQEYLDGWMLDYNYFRPHHAIGKETPAQKAGLKAPFENWQGVAGNVTAKTRRAKNLRPLEIPGFKPQRRMGRPRTRPRGRTLTQESIDHRTGRR